jgi:hypothetical protein
MTPSAARPLPGAARVMARRWVAAARIGPARSSGRIQQRHHAGSVKARAVDHDRRDAEAEQRPKPDAQRRPLKAELRRVLVRLQPDIEIVGMLSPPFRCFTEAGEISFADTINRANAGFVWVALPGVRMERWIIDNQTRYRRGVFLAVGDAFSLLSGRRSFAPPWMQRMGLTWAYRLCKEPIRLGPRYLRYNSMFVAYLLWDMLGGPAWQRSVR